MQRDWFEVRRQEMLKLYEQVDPREGAWLSPIPGVMLIKNSHSYPPVVAFYEPCIVLVAQGQKRFHFPDAALTYNARRYLLVTVPVPADCEGLVGKDGPFLGMAVRVDMQVLTEMVLLVEPSPRRGTRTSGTLQISAPAIDENIAHCGVRLLRAMLSRSQAAVLGPLLVRELHFHVLNGEAGGMLRALLTGDAGRQSIHRALGRMHADFAAPFQVERVARDAGVSVSTFHERFREVTGNSPLHYLKQLRLHRARTMMVQTGLTAAQVSEQVGYVSQSQFSREFKREFGRTPVEEARQVRKGDAEHLITRVLVVLLASAIDD